MNITDVSKARHFLKNKRSCHGVYTASIACKTHEKHSNTIACNHVYNSSQSMKMASNFQHYGTFGLQAINIAVDETQSNFLK